MRVAVEGTSVAPGGGLSFLRGAVQALAGRQSFEVDVFVQPALARESFGAGVRTHLVGPFRGVGHRLAWVQSRFPLHVAHHDAIFAPGNLAPIAVAGKTALFIQNAHVVPQSLWRAEYRDRKRRLQRLMARLSIQRAGRVLFISETLKTWAQPYWEANPVEPAVAYPGVTLEAKRTVVRREGRDVLVVGNLVPHKRVDRALHAFALLTRSGVRAGRLRIAGGGESGDLTRVLREVAARDGIAERVDFLGFVGSDELARAYAESGCYLSTSALEAFPLPPLEAMAAGTPAVVPDTPPFREVCGAAGVYCADDDDAIAKRLADALDYPAWQGDLRQAARQRAASFGWSAFADTLAAALIAVANRLVRRASRRSAA